MYSASYSASVLCCKDSLWCVNLSTVKDLTALEWNHCWMHTEGRVQTSRDSDQGTQDELCRKHIKFLALSEAALFFAQV